VVPSLSAAPVINNPPSVVQNVPTPPVANNPSPLEQTSNLSAPTQGTTQNFTQSVQNQSIASDITNPSPIQSIDNYRNNNQSNSQSSIADSQLRGLSVVNSSPVTVAASSPILATLESDRTQEFADYLGEDIARQFLSTKSARDILADIAAETGNQSAVLYVTANPEALQLVLYTSSGETILKTVPEANREKLLEVVAEFRETIVNPRFHRANSYLPLARQLYAWMVAPMAQELEAANIDTLLFSMGSGLRGLPVAALHDGEEFLVQKYSLSLIPSISLMDARYQSLDSSRVLAMGASEFATLNPLPAVPLEVTTIAGELWRGNSFLNQEFTLNNLVRQRQGYPYEIIHLATHAEFQPGAPGNSYIQLWDDKLQVDRVRQLGWNDPAVELLVLSACRTAVGDTNAELGFAGLAVAAGVKSAMASLWYVSDEGTLALMTEFYTHLNNAEIKSEALRQAQLAMIEGKVAIEQGELRGSGVRGAVVLPPELFGAEGANLSHPYYWSGFTMIGSPW
jgi:CHAT domain-containing protein